MKPKAVLSLSLPCTSWVMLKYLKYAEIFEIFGKICQKYAERWNIFAQFTLPMTNESKSLISAYWHLYMSVELGLEAYLAHFTKYLQRGNNICNSYKYHFKVPCLRQYVRSCDESSPEVGRKWKWSNGVKISEMGIV